MPPCGGRESSGLRSLSSGTPREDLKFISCWRTRNTTVEKEAFSATFFFSFLKFSFCFIYFYMYKCFAGIYVCVSHVCLVPTEARRWVLDPLELELRMVGNYPYGCWDSNHHPPEEQPVLLTTDLSFNHSPAPFETGVSLCLSGWQVGLELIM